MLLKLMMTTMPVEEGFELIWKRIADFKLKGM